MVLEKAFDSVNLKYLELVLKQLQFGNCFLNAIAALYHNPMAMLKVNDSSSRAFKLEQGIRQGCPLSPLLFAIALEPLAAYIRSHPLVTGINIGHEEHKLGLYADYIVLFLSGISSSIPVIQNTFSDFARITGLKVNFTKSEVFPMYLPREDRIMLADAFPFKWTKVTWKYLGIFFPLDLLDLKEVNFKPLVKTVRKLTEDWKKREFSWLDRLQILKTFILPKFLFLFCTFLIDSESKEIHSWQKLCNRFLWAFKSPRILYFTLRRLRELGGIGLPDLQDYYGASQLTTIFPMLQTFSQNNWTCIEEHFADGIPLMDLLWRNAKDRPISSQLNPFLTNSLRVWEKYRVKLAPGISPLSSFLNQATFAPLNNVGEASGWHGSGLDQICDLFQSKRILGNTNST